MLDLRAAYLICLEDFEELSFRVNKKRPGASLPLLDRDARVLGWMHLAKGLRVAWDARG